MLTETNSNIFKTKSILINVSIANLFLRVSLYILNAFNGFSRDDGLTLWLLLVNLVNTKRCKKVF